MAVVAITGGPGAPGATSAALALLLSWPLTDGRRVLLLECDPDGGAVLAGALQGQVDAGAGLRNLALADRRGRLLEAMWEQCLDLSPGGTGDRLLLPGLTDPAQAAALAYTWAPLAQACQSLDAYGCDVIVDLGRSGGQGASAVMARQADAVLAVMRTTLRGLSAARPRVAALAADLTIEGVQDALGLLLVQEGPYSAAEISRLLRVPVLGLLPYAPKEARILSDGGRTADRRFQRSQLMRAARSTADELRPLIARRRGRMLLPPPGAATTAAPAGEEPTAATTARPAPPGQAAQARPQPFDMAPPPGQPTRPGLPDRFAPPSHWGDEASAPTVAGTAGDPVNPPAASGDLPVHAAPAASAGLGYRPAQGSVSAVPSTATATARHGRHAMSVQDVLDLAAAAELGGASVALPPEPVPPALQPMPPSPGQRQGPGGVTNPVQGTAVTPGQAARLQAVHLEPVAQPYVAADYQPSPQDHPRPSYRPAAADSPQPSDDDRDWFTPLHAAPPPPLAEHAPRPPMPEQIRPPATPPSATPPPATPPPATPPPATPPSATPPSGEVAHVR